MAAATFQRLLPHWGRGYQYQTHHLSSFPDFNNPSFSSLSTKPPPSLCRHSSSNPVLLSSHGGLFFVQLSPQKKNLYNITEEGEKHSSAESRQKRQTQKREQGEGSLRERRTKKKKKTADRRKNEILPLPSLQQPQTSVLGFRPRNRRTSSTVGLSLSGSRPSSNPPLT
jgi:hypothetical protein